MGATCTHAAYPALVSKVIQIRDVPDDVHEHLTEAAAARGLSLTRYVRRELEHLALRSHVVDANAAVVRRTQAGVDGQIDRRAILEALREGLGV